MTQPTVPARGIIFDFDGVLIDSEPLYMRSVNMILAECDAPQLSRDEYQEHIGSTAKLTWEALTERNNFPDPASSYPDRDEVILEELLRDELQLRPEAEALLAKIADVGVKRGLATASRRKWMSLKLEKLGLVDYFDAAVCSTDVRRTKPAPDIYLKAAELMDLPTDDAVAIEDSPSGIRSAKAAGIRTIGLRTDMTTGLDLSHADEIIHNLQEFDVDRYFGEGAALAPTGQVR